ncbi:MAG: hypothetical protein IK051_00140 [Rhodocyclaceae bacterium]|nr:hypothetical protein [Rhodocyclaceae bacterium]
MKNANAAAFAFFYVAHEAQRSLGRDGGLAHATLGRKTQVQSSIYALTGAPQAADGAGGRGGA